MYVNYSVFKNAEKCITGRVWVPAWKIFVCQSFLVCNVRPSVIPLDTPDEFPEDSKIFVFPKNKEALLVFTYNQIEKTYEFRQILYNFQWSHMENIRPNIFDSSIGLPKSYSTISGMYNQLHNKVQHLNENRSMVEVLFSK